MADHVCPVWVGHLLASPIRRLFQKPEAILKDLIKKDMKVLDVGSAMGFFSIPMAKMVAPGGEVTCVDLQQKMLDGLMKKAAKAGVADRIKPHLGNGIELDLRNGKPKFDFALAFAVMHETPDQVVIFTELFEILHPGSNLLIAEPKNHVSEKEFDRTVGIALETGFSVVGCPIIRGSRAVILQKSN